MSALGRAWLYLGLVLLAGLTKAPAAHAQNGEGTARARAIHLLQRATYGPRPQDIDAVLSTGTADWLDLQLHPERIDDSALDPRLASASVATMSLPQLLEQYPPGQVLQPLRELAQDDSLSSSERRTLRRELGERGPRRILADMSSARLTRAVHSERQLEEMMTAFWFDHFNVFWGKGATRWLVSDYERTAIRANVFGKFEDMVLATAQHPAMLFYLDNFQSVAPDSSLRARDRRDQVARRIQRMPPQARDRAGERMAQTRDREREQRGRTPGLNENYARELMELHTLGVDGGYTQADVIDVARILTGWTFQQPGRRMDMQPGNRMDMRQARASFEDGRVVWPDVDYTEAYRFRFRAELHDAGKKTVMGRSFEAGGGQEEGVELIRTLARDPSTARHIATQLATRFVADEPPTSLVDRLAEVFLATDGDLREVTRVLFTSDEFYASGVGDRVKSPFLLVASTLRLTHGHMPNAGDRLFDEIRRAGGEGLPGLVSALLPGVETAELMTVILDNLRTNPPEQENEGGVRALGLILGSPEFQRH